MGNTASTDVQEAVDEVQQQQADEAQVRDRRMHAAVLCWCCTPRQQQQLAHLSAWQLMELAHGKQS